uniref:CarD family transcriptional regulator n=1 Tax=Alkalibacter rhizosphaerae TaxID=2815577 RepID=UPI001FF01720|nr:CarD family transcriptional regulator [Alkalibacter rhizosphaerae]
MKKIKDRLLQIVKRTKTMDALHQCYQEQCRGVGLYHCEDPVKVIFGLALVQDKKNQLFLCASESKAKAYAKIVDSIDPKRGCYLPSEPYHDLFLENRSKEVTRERLAALARISEEKGLLVFATPDIFTKKLSPKEVFRKSRLSLKVEEQIAYQTLVEKLTFLGYQRAEQVEHPGEFGLRGGIVDVFDIGATQPYRIEFFDDEVDSIRIFGPEDQKSVEKLEKIIIHPAREVLLKEEELAAMHDGALEALMESRRNTKNKDVKKGFGELAEKIRERQMKNWYSLIPWCSQPLVDLLDWFGSQERIFMDEADGFAELLQESYQHIQEEYVNLLEKGSVVPGMLEAIQEPYQVQKKLQSFHLLVFQRLHKRIDTYPVDREVDVASREIYSFYGRVGALADQITDWFAKEYHVYVSYEDPRELSALKEMLGGYQIAFTQEWKESDPDRGSVHLVRSGIQKGFELYKDKVVWLTYQEIFKKETRKKKKRRGKGKKIEHFTQLQVGDYVVHDVHGVGMYMGIEQIAIEGIKKDFLKLTYGKGDNLYIPVDQMEAIQTYMNFGEKEPKLNRLDSAEWKRVKSNAKKAVEDLAKELVELYARRKSVQGHAYPPTTNGCGSLKKSFPTKKRKIRSKPLKM